MERSLRPRSIADVMDAPDGPLAEERHRELDYTTVRVDRWRGADSYDQETVHYSPHDFEGARSARSFATTLRPRPLARISEEIFEQIAIERSEAAFSEFYEGLSPKIYSFAFRLLRVEDDALDVLQDTFVEVWRKSPVLYNIHTNLAAWGLHIARHFAIDLFRSKHYQRRKVTEPFEAERHENIMLADQTPEEALAVNEARLEIKNAIEKLSPDQRKSIELVIFSDLSQKAAAEKLHLPYTKFKNIYYDSLTELEHELLPFLRKKKALGEQRGLKGQAVERKRGASLRKREALQATQDAAARAEVLRKYVLGLPFADERNVI